MLWFDGRYCLIEKPSPCRWALLDYLRCFGKKNDDVRTIEIGYQTPQLLAVFLVFSVASMERGLKLRYLRVLLRGEHAGRVHSFAAVQHHFLSGYTAKRTQVREIINGFEQIRLARAVVPVNIVES